MHINTIFTNILKLKYIFSYAHINAISWFYIASSFRLHVWTIEKDHLFFINLAASSKCVYDNPISPKIYLYILWFTKIFVRTYKYSCLYNAKLYTDIMHTVFSVFVTNYTYSFESKSFSKRRCWVERFKWMQKQSNEFAYV